MHRGGTGYKGAAHDRLELIKVLLETCVRMRYYENTRSTARSSSALVPIALH